MRASPAHVAGGVLAAWWLLAIAAPAQAASVSAPQEAPPPVRLVAFTNEPREPEIGEVFALNLTVRIAPDMVAFLPDTLIPARDAVSAGAGSWELGIAPADSIDVRATYPVMGLDPGGVMLPTLEVWTRPARPGEEPGPRPLVDLASTENGAGAGDATDGLQRTELTIGGALIMPLRAMTEAADGGLMPRPPADVLGGQWSVWLAAAVALVVAVAGLLGWLFRGRGAGGAGRMIGLTPRAEALKELDRLRELGWHANGHVVEFYDATTGVLRRFAELTQDECGRYLTSSELLGRLADRWGTDGVGDLKGAVWSAERVKFGYDRPEPPAAESDWATVRGWIERLPERS